MLLSVFLCSLGITGVCLRSTQGSQITIHSTRFSICVFSFSYLPITGTPSSLALCGQRPMRKRLSAPEWQLSLTEGTGENGASPTRSASSSSAGSLDLEVDELETPSDSEQLDSGHEFEWEGGSQAEGGAGRGRS